MLCRRERRRITGAPDILVLVYKCVESMLTLEKYKEYYANETLEQTVLDIFELHQENELLKKTNDEITQITQRNTMLEKKQTVLEWLLQQQSQELEDLKNEIIHLKQKFTTQQSQELEDLKNEIIHLKQKFATLHNPEAVTTPRTGMLACQNPYMIH
jgi:chromosome segregation ATPase